MKSKLFLFLCVFILIGCASNGAGRKTNETKKFTYPRKKLRSLLPQERQKMLSKLLDQSGFGAKELIRLYI